MLVRILPAAIAVTLLLGCIGPQVQKESQEKAAAPQAPIANKEKVVYVVPKSTVFLTQADGIGKGGAVELKGIWFPEQSQSREAGYNRKLTEATSCQYDRPTGELLCTRTRQLVVYASGFAPATWNAYQKYYVTVSAAETPDSNVLTLEPRLKEARGERTLAENVKAPPFTEDEVYDVLGKGRLRFKFEVDSQYDEKSVKANFTRILGNKQVRWEGMMVYKLPAENGEVGVAVEVWPYRGGSKVGVTATVSLFPTSTEPGVRTVDVKKIIDNVRKEIEKIVNS